MQACSQNIVGWEKWWHFLKLHCGQYLIITFRNFNVKHCCYFQSHLCVDYVILTGRQMLKLVFFKSGPVLQFRAPSRYWNCLFRVRHSFQIWFWCRLKKIKINIQKSTLNLSFNALLKWHDPHITGVSNQVSNFPITNCAHLKEFF